MTKILMGWSIRNTNKCSNNCCSYIYSKPLYKFYFINRWTFAEHEAIWAKNWHCMWGNMISLFLLDVYGWNRKEPETVYLSILSNIALSIKVLLCNVSSVTGCRNKKHPFFPQSGPKCNFRKFTLKMTILKNPQVSKHFGYIFKKICCQDF